MPSAYVKYHVPDGDEEKVNAGDYPYLPPELPCSQPFHRTLPSPDIFDTCSMGSGPRQAQRHSDRPFVEKGIINRLENWLGTAKYINKSPSATFSARSHHNTVEKMASSSSKSTALSSARLLSNHSPAYSPSASNWTGIAGCAPVISSQWSEASIGSSPSSFDSISIRSDLNEGIPLSRRPFGKPKQLNSSFFPALKSDSPTASRTYPSPIDESQNRTTSSSCNSTCPGAAANDYCSSCISQPSCDTNKDIAAHCTDSRDARSAMDDHIHDSSVAFKRMMPLSKDCQASTSAGGSSTTTTTTGGRPPLTNHSHSSQAHLAPQTNGISRKKIISQSHETGLNELDSRCDPQQDEDDDVWCDKNALFQHHLREVLEKWNSIDDEIWGKIICMEKNRRVAKAYARVPVLTINGSHDGFDGYRIGLSGFDNPRRSFDTERVKERIGQGIKLKMDNEGNILIKRVSTAPVFVYNTHGHFDQDHCFSTDVVKCNGQLDVDKAVKVFDMKRFTANITKELKTTYPDRRKLELQCFTNIVFVDKMDNNDHLDLSCWIMLINIVALDMLKNKLPSGLTSRARNGALFYNQRLASSFAVHQNDPLNSNSDGGRNSQRFLSTPRDDHYPRLINQHSLAELSMLDNTTDYGSEDFDDRASVSTYNFVPPYHAGPSLLNSAINCGILPSDYADFNAGHHQQRRDAYRSLEQQLYLQNAYYGLDGGGGSDTNGAPFGGNYRSATPLGLSHHALTEPNFRLRDTMIGVSGRNFAAPSLQRFADGGGQGQLTRQSRSYDSGLESDLTSSSDETDNYNRWTSYQRLHMIPRQIQQIQGHHHNQSQQSRLPSAEWE